MCGTRRRARRDTDGSVSALKSKWEEMSARCGFVEVDRRELGGVVGV